jgi:hypothetical protein
MTTHLTTNTKLNRKIISSKKIDLQTIEPPKYRVIPSQTMLT